MTPHEKGEHVEFRNVENQRGSANEPSLANFDIEALRSDINALQQELKKQAKSRSWTVITITLPVLLTSILAGATWYVQTTSQRKYDAFVRAIGNDREARKSHIELIAEINRQLMNVILADDDLEKRGDTSVISKSLQDFYKFVQQVRPQLHQLSPDAERAIETFTSDIERWRQFFASSGRGSGTAEEIVRYKTFKAQAATTYKTLNSVANQQDVEKQQ